MDAAPRPPQPGAAARWLKPLVWVGVLAALAATFAAYLSPHLARDLADMVWACFG